MGTRVDIDLVAASPIQAADLTANIERAMLRWGLDWYPWGNATGELKRINAAFQRGESAQVSPELRDLLIRAQQFERLSDGYFDPAVAPMVAAWGFSSMPRPLADPPTAKRLAEWANNHPTMSDLIIDGDTVSSTRRDLQLDLGAIAKGYAVDLALRRLKSNDIRQATINIGGELEVMGATTKHIRVGIRDPRQEAYLAWLVLHGDESISSSGDYERFAIVNGQRIHHLLDPHTGEPVPHTQAVTVLAHDATLADAASTALMAAGPDNWRRIARQLGITEALRIDSNGAIEVTAALYARLQWNETAASNRKVTQLP